MKHQSLFNIDDTRVNRIILLIISLLCSVHYVSYIISIISWVYIHDTLHYAFFALLHVFLISVFITYQLTFDTSAGVSRKDRMASQGGHTLMLVCFGVNHHCDHIIHAHRLQKSNEFTYYTIVLNHTIKYYAIPIGIFYWPLFIG